MVSEPLLFMPLNNSQREYRRTASPFIKVGNNRILKIVQRHIIICWVLLQLVARA
jgi:hypothetical protein